MAIDCKEIAGSWLRKYAQFLSSSDIKGAISAFLPHGWLRDVLIFTWDNRSLGGRAAISEYLAETLGPAQISNVKLDNRPGLEPTFGPVTPTHLGVSAGFSFTSAIAHGKGYFRLLLDEQSGEWKALSVFMAAEDLKGYEEAGHEDGIYGGHTLSWEEVRRERTAQVEVHLHVLIVGGGQTGLNIAVRFKQMNIPSIVIEANDHIGDNWRKRYPTLALHTVRSHHSMLYQSYPKNWPIYTPRDKIADWLEQYVGSQDLIVWTKSRILPVPRYDPCTKTWTAIIERDGTHIELHPAQIVLATGALGPPRIPSVVDKEVFQGSILHASVYQGGHPFVGKRVIVVGAGNTAADICQDLSFRGAQSITMVQRSSTCVVSQAVTRANFNRIWPEHLPTEICDFKFFATPLMLLRKMLSAQEEAAWARDKEMYDGLRKAGLKLNMGEDGSGYFPMAFERFGGYWIDVGCAPLIISGKVKVKQGVEIERCASDAVVFTDGSSLEADAIIFATGYHNIRDTMKDLFGQSVIDRTSEVWGLDAEGELRGCYRPSGHPGLWFGVGDFSNSRFSSKQLALEIKAIELGLMVI